ncbi:hypothetical protein EEL32_11705 [Brevibacillus laterosporus]|uniref:Uncharacterized protein n=1 Tax=Brevibacillus laterosporus TaxID=1465 RepID=A0A502ING2_BRELA|nr:hypothetical protein EEL30_25615 [Brevibacillus laterosporus]TPG69269.1 hypothetical protein EEL31_12540 [Brevibacillus laterosporus]TPG86780.1 hypothetical protein EEL32_11705 [Brevibacillus laterosporus]
MVVMLYPSLLNHEVFYSLFLQNFLIYNDDVKNLKVTNLIPLKKSLAIQLAKLMGAGKVIGVVSNGIKLLL